MSISPIGSYAAQAYQANTTQRTNSASKEAAAKEAEKNSSAKTNAENNGVVYEKSSAANTITKTKDKSAIVAKLKSDVEARTAQMKSFVQKLMGDQGKKIGAADDIWKFLAGGNFTVSAAAKAEAQQAISEDGYWGVNQTSDRILEFAKALSGDDPSKADELLAAFKKGYKMATGSWGSKLPDISSRTYDAVVEKFDAWKNESKTEAAKATEDVTKTQA